MTDPTQTPGPVLTVPGAPLAFHVMAKPTGAVCNLDCEYCFFLSKEMLYPGSRFRMAEERQEAYVRQLLEAHARSPEWKRCHGVTGGPAADLPAIPQSG